MSEFEHYDQNGIQAPPEEQIAFRPERLDPADVMQEEPFEPDFGNTFDDYGDYKEPTAEPVIRRIRKPSLIKKIRIPRILFVAIYFALIVGLGILLANYGWKFADDALGLTRPDDMVEIVITDKDDLDDVTAKLKEVGLIRYDFLFKKYCQIRKNTEFFDPGIYHVKLSCDYHAIVNNLNANAVSRETVTVMIREGEDCFEIFDLLEKNGVCTREKLEEAAANYKFNYEFLRRIPYQSSNRLEGYLFPDTYQFYLMDEPENVLGRLLRNFNAKLDEDDLALVEKSGYSLKDIITMASIVEAEAGSDEERYLIASVIYNRLTRWDYGERKLGMDSTVYYGAKLLGKGFSTALESRYNTYKYEGLPPGPICNPGLNSIRAVLNPEETDYFYFATDVNGKNRFFETKEAFEAFLASDEYQDIIPDEYKQSEDD